MNNKHALWSVTLLAVLTGCGKSGSESFGGIEGSGSPVTSAGAVLSLGSVFVNGVKYDLTGAAITVDGQLARESDLAVGNIVVVEGAVNADGVTGRATRVTAGTAVAGPIDSLDVAGNTFIVLGQTVEVDLATTIEESIEGQPLGSLAVGSDIEVSGFANSSGTITARRIVQRVAQKPLQVTGYIAQLDTLNRRFAVNGAIVDYSSARLIGFGTQALDGAAVRVLAKALDPSGALVADEVMHRDAGLPGAVGVAAALQGWVTRYASPTDFDVDGYRVVATSATKVIGDLRLDAFVQVTGNIVAEGAVQMSQIVNTGPYKFIVKDAVGEPLEGALVTFVAGGRQYQATTGTDGTATFADAPMGEIPTSVSAPNYDTYTFIAPMGTGSRAIILRLQPVGAWAIGRAIVLGTRMVDRASDGSTMTFAVDIAVINEHSEAIQTLTSANFSAPRFDCTWNGPRGCASDSSGNMTGGVFTGGPPQAFGLQQAAMRRPYRARVLVVRNYPDAYWDEVVPALKSFFARVGGNDSVSLSSVRLEGGVATHAVLGPFTSDGSLYFDAIDGLPSPVVGEPGFGEPAMLQSLNESIASVAGPGAEPNVVVLAPSWMQLPDTQAATALARQLGVHVSAVDLGTYGVAEMTPRTGGFVAEIGPFRQLPMVLGALDPLLAGALPFYRMEFQLASERGTFVAGGNAKVLLNVNVPFPMPTVGIFVTADVEIQ